MKKYIQRSEIHFTADSKNIRDPEKTGSKTISETHNLKKTEDKSIDLSELLTEFKENLLFLFMM